MNIVKRLVSSLVLPPRVTSRELEVHSWGGMGSQLFAISTILRLKRVTARHLILVHHTSGVTRRPLDRTLLELFEIDFREIDDFALPNSPISLADRSSYKSGILKTVLRSLALIRYSSTAKILPWTRQIRDHYFFEKLEVETLDTILSTFRKTQVALSLNPNMESVLIHYRLGDLDEMGVSTMSIDSLMSLLLDLRLKDSPVSILIVSDSPSKAQIVLGRALNEIGFDSDCISYPTLTPLEVIRLSLDVDFFIGSGSKISYWSCILRMRSSSNAFAKTFVPRDKKLIFERLLGEHPSYF